MGPRSSIDWPINRVHPTDTLHMPTLPRHAHVNSAVRNGDSYKTENVDDGKAKSRDTHTTNCKAGTRERPANLFILALPCWCRHASLGFSYGSFFFAGHFTQTPFHTFLHKHNMCTLHSGQDLRTRVMHTGGIDPTLSLSMPPTTQLRQARPQQWSSSV